MIRLTLRLPDEMHAWLKTAADEDRRSLNAEILTLLSSAIEARVSSHERSADGRQLISR